MLNAYSIADVDPPHDRPSRRRLRDRAVVDDFIEGIMDNPGLNANPHVNEVHHRLSKAGFKYWALKWSVGPPVDLALHWKANVGFP